MNPNRCRSSSLLRISWASHARRTAIGQARAQFCAGRAESPLTYLDNLAKRFLAPLLKATKIERHDLYSLRRGIATTLTGLPKDPLAAKGLLRHSNVATTMQHYIGDVPEKYAGSHESA
jgi:hypothetical protein